MNTRKKCAIISCQEVGGRMFSFPNPTSRPEIFLKWLEASENPDLLTLSNNKIRNRVICAKHFETRYFLPKRLSNTAVPTLFLSDIKEEIKVEECKDEPEAMKVVQLPQQDLQIFKHEPEVDICSPETESEQKQRLFGNLRRGETAQFETPSTTDIEERLNGKLHILQPDAKGKHSDCLVCSNHKLPGGRNTTLYFCETCNRKPFLHVGDCFKKYHTLKTYR